MRKIVAGLFMSLDGVVEAPERGYRYFSQELTQSINEGISQSDAVLLGRRTDSKISLGALARERYIHRITYAAGQTISLILPMPRGDMAFHVRGTLPRVGDHRGVEGFLGVIGTIVDLTAGDVKLEQLFAIADKGWAAEWERALFGRNGRTLDVHNAFIYRFEDGRIAEMWMIGAGPAGSESFFE
jgi:hypothetical protein